MKENKKRCCGPEGCPCYPNCDRMMSENWSPRAEKEIETGCLDMDNRELMKLAKQDEEDLARMKELKPMGAQRNHFAFLRIWIIFLVSVKRCSICRHLHPDLMMPSGK